MPRSEDESIASFVRRVTGEPVAPITLEPDAVLAGRFRVLFKHGQGGMGQVFAAYDNVRQTEVAIKLLGQRTPQGIALLKREFRAAADIVHPNLVRLHELFADGNDWFFSMESIQGSTLPARLPLAADRDRFLRSVMGQLACGLAALHRAGTLHGDLKPSNFLIADADDRVVLLDFGLARSKWANQPFEVAGTPRYWAPEQGRARPISEASDWYAFGVVLYEALTGELPRREPSVALLRAAPPDLAGLCLSLLQQAPEDRASGDAVLATLGVVPDRHASSIPPPPPRAARAPILFGRDRELARLNEAFLATLQDGPRIVLIHGPSGIGKTTLVQRFVREARDGGAFVLEGRCREREAIGYKAIDSLIDDLVAQLASLPSAVAAQLMPADVADLLMAFPALRETEALAHAEQPAPERHDYARVRARAFRAFAELIAGLRRLRPLVIWLDDLQWSDRESALLLGPVLGGSEPVPVLFVASYRPGLAHGGPLLAALADPRLQLPAANELGLEPLDALEAENMARSLLPRRRPERDALARDIGRDAGGHPLFIAELTHAAEQLEGPAVQAPLPVSLVALVTERIQRLSRDARGLLECVAIAAEPLPRTVLRNAVALAPADAEEALDLLRANRLVRSEGAREHDAIDSHHDRVREIVLQAMPPRAARERHLSLARSFEASGDCPPARLAYHYEAAGEAERAGRYFIAAADRAFGALAFSQAADSYAKGVRLASLDRDVLREVQLRRADALALAGKAPDAADVYLAVAAEIAGDAALELRRRAAQELLLAGHLGRGLSLLEDVLKAVGMRPTCGGRRALPRLVAGRLWLDLRGFRYAPRSESQLTAAERIQLDTAWTTAWSLAFTDPIRAAEFQTRHMRLALRAGEPRRILQALTLEAPAVAARGARAGRAIARVLAAAEASAARTNDATAHGLLALTRGVCEYLQGRLEPALALCLQSLAGLGERGPGAVWERVNAQRIVLSSLFLLGRMPELAAFLTPLLAEVEGTRNVMAATVFRTGYSTTAWLAADQLAEADRQLALAREGNANERGFDLIQYGLLIGQTLRDMYAGEYELAQARLLEAWPRIAESQLLMIGVVRLQLTHARAMIALALANRFDARGEIAVARELRRKARLAGRAIAREPVPRAHPLALAIEAATDFPAGLRESAQHKLAACAAELDAQRLQLFAAAARWRLAEITTPADDTARLAARAEFEAQRVAKPERLVDLFAPVFPG